MNNKMALSALFCAGVMVSGCGMWSDRDSGRSGQSSNRSSASTAQGASKTQAAGAQSRTQIAEVQQALKAKGFDPGTTDGTMGPQTQEALRKFQKANGLPVTGNIDSQTAKALGVSTSAGATGSSSGSSTSGASSSREGAGSSSGSQSGTSGSSSSGSGRSGGSSSSGGSGSSGSGGSGLDSRGCDGRPFCSQFDDRSACGGSDPTSYASAFGRSVDD